MFHFFIGMTRKESSHCCSDFGHQGDLLAMDSTTCQFIDSLRNIDKEGVTEDTFSDIIFENFVAKTCDGMEVCHCI